MPESCYPSARPGERDVADTHVRTVLLLILAQPVFPFDFPKLRPPLHPQHSNPLAWVSARPAATTLPPELHR